MKHRSIIDYTHAHVTTTSQAKSKVSYSFCINIVKLIPTWFSLLNLPPLVTALFVFQWQYDTAKSHRILWEEYFAITQNWFNCSVCHNIPQATKTGTFWTEKGLFVFFFKCWLGLWHLPGLRDSMLGSQDISSLPTCLQSASRFCLPYSSYLTNPVEICFADQYDIFCPGLNSQGNVCRYAAARSMWQWPSPPQLP